MKVKKTAALSLGVFMLLSNGMPVFAESNTSIMNVTDTYSKTVEATIDNVSNIIQDNIDAIEIETPEPQEEVSYTYVEQPVYYTVTETVSEPIVMSYDEFNALYGKKEIVEVPVDTSAQQAAYDAALANYNAALAEYEAASQIIETTKEVEVEVLEETVDDQGNPITETKTEIQTVTETAYAGDVTTAQANLDAAKAALDAAGVDLTSAQNTTVEVEVEEQTVEQPAAAVEYTPASGQIDNLTWKLDGLGILTISGTGAIPAEGPWGEHFNTLIVTEGVESILNGAFSWNEELTSVTLHATVTEIGDQAFFKCKQLTSVDLPAGVGYIGNEAFSGCENLPRIVIPESVSYIGKEAFYNCGKLTDVTILGPIQSIEESTFAYCESLQNVELPASVKSIAFKGFYSCGSLERISIPENVETIGGSAFYGCSSLYYVTIPSRVQNIASYTFYGCTSLDTVKFPETLTGIGDMAFWGCESLVGVNLPSRLISIGDRGFYGCKSLINLVLPGTFTDMGEYAFYGCEKLQWVEFANSITAIPKRAFANCTSLKELKLPDSVTSIGEFAYYNTPRLITAYLPGTIEEIQDYALNGSGLTDLYFDGTKEQWNAVYIGTKAIGDSVRIHFETEVEPVQEVRHTLSLEGDIGVNFYIHFADEVLQDTTARVDLSVGGTTASHLVSEAATTVINDVLFHIFNVKVKSIQMADDIDAKVFVLGNEEVYKETYRVRDYCMDKIQSSTDEKLVTLLKSLLNYGGYSQVMFNYNTADLANKDLDDTDVSDVRLDMLVPYQSVKSGEQDGIELAGSTLTLDSLTTIKHYFKLADGYDISDFMFVLKGNTLTPIKSGDLYYVEIPNIVSYDLDTMYTVTVGGFGIQYGALSYAYNQLNKASAKEELKNVVRALYKYNQAANKYFNK